MSEVTVLQNQNLLDIALQQYGTIENVLQLALANNLSVTDTLVVGSKLTVPILDNTVNEVVFLFKTRSMKPASALTLAEIELIENEDCGIGCMVVDSTFITR